MPIHQYHLTEAYNIPIKSRLPSCPIPEMYSGKVRRVVDGTRSGWANKGQLSRPVTLLAGASDMRTRQEHCSTLDVTNDDHVHS